LQIIVQLETLNLKLETISAIAESMLRFENLKPETKQLQI